MSNLNEEILLSVRRLIALQLWELGAVKVNFEEPYKLTSGNYSPIYLNCRQLLSSAAFADLFAAAARIICQSQDVGFDVLAGGESAGIPFAAYLARAFGKPMAYVRKEAKEHGLSSLVEGSSVSGKQVLLVEDLITDAGSKLHFIKAIKDAGGNVTDVIVAFDRQQGGAEALQREGIRLLWLTNMDTALVVAESASILQTEQFASIKEYLRSPRDWHAQRQLPYIEMKNTKPL